MNDKREIIAACLRDRHTSADAILNALHQAGWQITPKTEPRDVARPSLEHLTPGQRLAVTHAIADQERDVELYGWILYVQARSGTDASRDLVQAIQAGHHEIKDAL